MRRREKGEEEREGKGKRKEKAENERKAMYNNCISSAGTRYDTC